jgi:hypothetical protein
MTADTDTSMPCLYYAGDKRVGMMPDKTSDTCSGTTTAPRRCRFYRR